MGGWSRNRGARSSAGVRLRGLATPRWRHRHAALSKLGRDWLECRIDQNLVMHTEFWTLARRRAAGAPIGLALFGWLTIAMGARSGWAWTALTMGVVLGGAWGVCKPADIGGERVSMAGLGGFGAVGGGLLLASLASAMSVSAMLPAIAAGFMAYWFTNGLKALLRQPTPSLVADGRTDGDPG